MKSLFEYMDYRNYLRDYYEEEKRDNYFFSARYIASKVGMDHSLLVKVMLAHRHIGDKAIPKFIKLYKLKKKKAQYFEALVHFTKSKTEQQKNLYFEKMLACKGYNSLKILDFQYEYFQKWYYAAVRSILDYYKFKGDFKALGEQLNPSITAHEAKRAIRLLEQLKFIKKHSNGQYRITNAHVTTGDLWKSFAIINYQKETIKMSSESLERDPKELRDISSITMSMDKECFKDIKEILKECRVSIIKRVNSIKDENIDRLYQLNLQLIPLSKHKVKN